MTVVLTEDALENLAYATLAGLGSSVQQNSVTQDAATTDNAKTALASVYLVGTEDTALWKDVHEVVLGMDSVEWQMTAIGSASASMDGTVLTALR